ncbi:MAG: hypothetical protein R3D03_01500 [Geminicoccaceae bacterium]
MPDPGSHYMRFSGNAPVAFTYYSLALSVVPFRHQFLPARRHLQLQAPSSLYEQAKRLIMVWPLVVALMLALGFMAQILDEVSFRLGGPVAGDRLHHADRPADRPAAATQGLPAVPAAFTATSS